MRKGFTLVELMIVVAIIGILAAIAIPNFVAMQYRAKRAELPTNVDGIKTAQIAYDAAFDTYVTCDDNPGTVQKEAVDWNTAAAGWEDIGWLPSGKIRGTYQVEELGVTDFKVTAECDVDGDTNRATYTATKSIGATMTTLQNIY